MRSRSARATRDAVLLALAVTLGACASTPAPRGWLPDARQSQRDAHGAWVNVEYSDWTQNVHAVWGELIASHDDSLFVATLQGLRGVAWTDVTRGVIVTYDPRADAATGWAMMGVLGSLTNGWFFVFTGPAWMIIGASTTHSLVRDATIKVPQKEPDMDSIAMYARFPQGLPEGVDRSRLKLAAPPEEEPKRPPSGYPTRPTAQTRADVRSFEYEPVRRVGGGVTAWTGLQTDGTLWAVGVCPRVLGSLFVTGTYGRTHGDFATLTDWTTGLRLGRKYFFGAKYIHSSSDAGGAKGWGAYGGILSDPHKGLSVGATFGYDIREFELTPARQVPTRDLAWLALMLQLTPSALKGRSSDEKR